MIGFFFEDVFNIMQINNLSDEQYRTVRKIGHHVHANFINDSEVNPEEIEAWIKWLYRCASKPIPRIIIVLSPAHIPNFTPDPSIATNSLNLLVKTRGEYISTNYSWKIRMWMYHTVFDQRIKGLFNSVSRTHGMVDQDQDIDRSHRNNLSSSLVFTVIDSAAIRVAEAYQKIDPLFPVSEFCCQVASFSKFGWYGLGTGEAICWVLKLPIKTETHPAERVPHSDKGPAIVWRDQSVQYYLHGIQFPKYVWEGIVKKEIPLKEIEGWRNTDMLREALRYLGPKALLDQCPAKLIDTSVKGNRLYNVGSISMLRNLKVLVYNCPSTGKEYHRFVKNWIEDADYAQSWRYQLRKNEYLSLMES